MDSLEVTIGHHITGDVICFREPLQTPLLLQLNKYIVNNWMDQSCSYSRAVEEWPTVSIIIFVAQNHTVDN